MDYSQIDPGIVDTVCLLNKFGFITTSSCEGGDGHAFPFPTINIAPQDDLDDTRKALCRFLLSRGAEGFTVSTVSLHQKSDTAIPNSFVQVQFWNQDTLRYLTF